jgi:hypothetical protein
VAAGAEPAALPRTHRGARERAPCVGGRGRGCHGDEQGGRVRGRLRWSRAMNGVARPEMAGDGVGDGDGDARSYRDEWWAVRKLPT